MFSALLFPDSKPAHALVYIAEHHEMILCERTIEELRDILVRKAPQFLPAAEELIVGMSYEKIPAVGKTEKIIRDLTDQPILNAAVLYDVDIILTGDKDFLSLNLQHPLCMSVSQFMENEVF